MVDFIRKRLQVFVSSTYEDLKGERQAAVGAILTAGHIPAGMELFTSGDETQMTVIKQWIDESDVYMLILAGRYGSVEPVSKKSYTQLEYEYALSISKPIFACVINETALNERVKTMGMNAMEAHHPVELKAFRELVLSKVVRFWDDEKDIKIAVGETLAQHSRSPELIGWVRPHHEANMPALTDELARLSKENAALREEVSRASISEQTIHGLSFSELSRMLSNETLLSLLIQYRQEFAVGSYASNKFREKIQKLCLYGLLNGTPRDTNKGPVYKLTDEGRVYLNKFSLCILEEYGSS